MMTVPMDNSSPSPREIVQRLFKKNIELENRRRKSAQARIPSDPNIWQQMRENYEAIILEDHAFSEQHEVEYALWQLHYRRIEELRAHFSAALAPTGSTTLPAGKSPARPDRIKKIRTQFKTFLSEATGFYHEFILKIRAKYGLPFGYFSEGQENQIIQAKDGKQSTELKKGLVSCHRCLIYLGDLARYKGLYGEGDSKTRDYAAASSYYLQAASFWPSSGNPHHQLAILASYSGDDLLSVYRYFRSLALDSPFSTARDNLVIAFEKNRQSYTQLPGDTKASLVKTSSARVSAKGRGKGEKMHSLKDTKVEIASREGGVSISEIYKVFCIRFVRLNGILFTRTSLETFGEVFSLVRGDLHELLSSGPEEELSFGVDAADNGLVIVRLIAILVFTVHNVNRETEGQSYAEILQRSVLLQNAYKAAFELVACIIERCAQLHDPTKSYLLPGVLVFVEWLAGRPDIAAGSDIEEKQATARSFFWKQCISFLNKLMSTESVSSTVDEDETCFFNMSRYDEGETGNQIALWEDFELRGFSPLLPAQLILDFSRKRSTGSNGGNQEKKIRVQRIIAAGKALMNVVKIDHQGIYFDHKMKKFAVGIQPQVPQVAPSDIPRSNGVTQEHAVEKIEVSGVVQPNLQYFEGEEEEEEIVFKPLVTEKPIDVVAANVYNYEAPASASAPAPASLPSPEPASLPSPAPASLPSPALASVPSPRPLHNGEWASYVESTTVPASNFHVQYALDASQQPYTSYANTVPQPMQPVNPNALNWHVSEQDFFPNGMQNLNVVGNGLVGKAEFEQGLGLSRPPVFSHSLPQSANFTVNSMFSDQTKASESMMVSQFDLIMSSGANTESLMMKPSTGMIAPVGKNSVSRPVRHPGPPPGFSLPPKPVDLPFGGPNLKNESPLFDDYRWLDGYQLPSSTKMMVPNDTFNSTAHVYPHVMNSNNSVTSAASFPFPGKQAPIMPVQVESEENWRGTDYKVLDHLNSYLEQQNQLQQPNQQSVPLPEQYEGHPLWSGRFFV